MANLTIEIPDDLVRSLEGIAAAQRKSVQQLALEQLSSLVGVISEPRTGSPAAVIRVMQESPHPSSADVDELDAAIAAGRLAVRTRDLFSTDPL
jgi:predicted transcriptional regulator